PPSGCIGPSGGPSTGPGLGGNPLRLPCLGRRLPRPRALGGGALPGPALCCGTARERLAIDYLQTAGVDRRRQVRPSSLVDVDSVRAVVIERERLRKRSGLVGWRLHARLPGQTDF